MSIPVRLSRTQRAAVRTWLEEIKAPPHSLMPVAESCTSSLTWQKILSQNCLTALIIFTKYYSAYQLRDISIFHITQSTYSLWCCDHSKMKFSFQFNLPRVRMFISFLAINNIILFDTLADLPTTL